MRNRVLFRTPMLKKKTIVVMFRGVRQEITVQKGRGDKVAAVAQPIAKFIDALSGGKTKLAKCGGCKQMQQDLNDGMPLVEAIRKRVARRKSHN